MLYFNPRVIGDDVIVTVQAFFHRRNPGMVGIPHIGVAVLALYLLYAAMDIVAERDRLFRVAVGQKQSIIYYNKSSCRTRNEQYQKNGYNIISQRLFPFLKDHCYLCLDLPAVADRNDFWKNTQKKADGHHHQA